MPANNVVSMAVYRQEKNLNFTVPARLDRKRYSCVTCDADRFLCLQSGGIACATCGALMTNLTNVFRET